MPFGPWLVLASYFLGIVTLSFSFLLHPLFGVQGRVLKNRFVQVESVGVARTCWGLSPPLGGYRIEEPLELSVMWNLLMLFFWRKF